jgi:hypothetical protein
MPKITALAGPILIAGLLVGCGGDDDSVARDDPLQLAQDFIAHVEHLNIDGLRQLVCDPDELPVSADNIRLQFTGEHFAEEHRSDTATEIVFTGHLRLLAGPAQQEADVTWIFDMEKQSGGWCVAHLDGDLFGLEGQ